MVDSNAQQYLSGVADACDRLREFTTGATLADYLGNAMMRSAVERQFEIIGKALNLMLRGEPTLAAHITNWKAIIGFRNRLAHGYATVDNNVVWGVLEENLDRLSTEVAHLLQELS